MMHLRFLKLPVSLLVLIILVSGCFESEYTRLVKAEMKKGVRYDSLLMGLKFGDTRNHFQGVCFDLNKAKQISAGASGTIQYIIKDSLTNLNFLIYNIFVIHTVSFYYFFFYNQL